MIIISRGKLALRLCFSLSFSVYLLYTFWILIYLSYSPSLLYTGSLCFSLGSLILFCYLLVFPFITPQFPSILSYALTPSSCISLSSHYFRYRLFFVCSLSLSLQFLSLSPILYSIFSQKFTILKVPHTLAINSLCIFIMILTYQQTSTNTASQQGPHHHALFMAPTHQRRRTSV